MVDIVTGVDAVFSGGSPAIEWTDGDVNGWRCRQMDGRMDGFRNTRCALGRRFARRMNLARRKILSHRPNIYHDVTCLHVHYEP